MKYYSEILGKTFNSEKDCLAAEAEYKKSVEEARQKKEALSKERKARATEVEDAFKEVVAAKEKYNKLLNDFCKDYGAFHFSWTGDSAAHTLLNFLDCF